MPKLHKPLNARLIGMVLLTGLAACSAAATSRELPNPTIDTPKDSRGDQVAVLAGGCFWGLQAVFEHVHGVRRVWAGYSGGAANTAHYDEVSEGDTGHAESVKIQFDPAVISYGQLLKIYFAVATDPTELNRQGPDTGTQYRSDIFYATPEQQKIAQAYVAQLSAAKTFDAPIVTRIDALKAFYPAESYHQDYARLHPDDGYIVINDAPKVAQLKRQFPNLYQPEQSVVDVQLQ